MTAERHCMSCGARLGLNAHFCGACGRRVAEMPEGSTGSLPSRSSRKRTRRPNRYYAAAGVILVVAAGGGGYAAYKHFDTSAQHASRSSSNASYHHIRPVGATGVKSSTQGAPVGQDYFCLQYWNHNTPAGVLRPSPSVSYLVLASPRPGAGGR